MHPAAFPMAVLGKTPTRSLDVCVKLFPNDFF